MQTTLKAALLNDASALLIYRFAVGAVVAVGISAQGIAPAFLLSLFGRVFVGLSLGWVMGRVMRSVADAPSSIILQFVSTYGVWVLAEQIG